MKLHSLSHLIDNALLASIIVFSKSWMHDLISPIPSSHIHMLTSKPKHIDLGMNYELAVYSNLYCAFWLLTSSEIYVEWIMKYASNRWIHVPVNGWDTVLCRYLSDKIFQMPKTANGFSLIRANNGTIGPTSSNWCRYWRIHPPA